jgi:YD repeat-containing protein
MRWNNFQSNSLPTTYPTSTTPAAPSYTSQVYDSGQTGTVTWANLSFTADVPAGTTLKFQVATSDSVAGPFTYVGPDGSTGTYFTSPGALALGTTGRYASYKAWLTSDVTGTLTPSFSAVALSFSLEGSNVSTQYGFGIDPAGNILSVTTTTDAGVSTDVRTTNSLNQIVSQVVTPAVGLPTTYVRTWNLDGTLATKSDGTNLWEYNWSTDGDQRLMSVVLNGVTLVAYTYDHKGRMLTRTVAGVVTVFEWDGWTCIRETTAGVQTRYYAPWDELLTFERGGVTLTRWFRMPWAVCEL